MGNDEKYKCILVIGPPRSGTSITTRIIQKHLRKEFPFEVSRHSEPIELVEIHNRFLERNDLDASSRLLFPRLNPDFKLMQEILQFFDRYKNIECVIKEPIASITYNWIQIPRMFRTIGVFRGVRAVAKSIAYHKRMNIDEETAIEASRWYHAHTYSYKHLMDSVITFTGRKDDYRYDLQRALRKLGHEWDPIIFEEEWDNKQIEPYKHHAKG